MNKFTIQETVSKTQKVMLVMADSKINKDNVDDILNELKELVKTAGGEVALTVVQNRENIDNNFVVGSGKIKEIASMAELNKIDLIIFENELTPVQLKNISKIISCRVIDRTNLILDIFALHATTAEGKLQVELAQLKYALPRLAGSSTELSKLGGGIGTRGPGESKLETDRRIIRSKLHKLEKDLTEVSIQREYLRERRKKSQVATVAIIGYTNAGKSTLLNALTGSDVLVENKLFATLDPTARKLNLPSSKNALIIDTVGFIRNLPVKLIEAFKSTLEETAYADIILNVCDASNKEVNKHIAVTLDTINQLKCTAPIITVYNKIDKLEDTDNNDTKFNDPNCIGVSAVNSVNLDKLLRMIDDILTQNNSIVELNIPYSKSKLVNTIKENFEVQILDFKPESIYIKANLDERAIEAYKEFIIK